jgi:hypothetical protein
MKKNVSRKLALSTETLRQLDRRWLDQAGAGEITGTATVTCPDRTCGNCLSALMAPCLGRP